MSVRFAAILSLSVLVSSTPLSAQRTVDAWRYTVRTSIDSGNGHVLVRSTRHVIADGLLRTEYTSNDAMRPQMMLGSFTVLNAKDSTFVSVTPAQRTVTITPAAIDAPMPPRPSIVTHVTSSSQAALGTGDSILGHETRRFRYTSAGTNETTIEGRTCTRPFDGTTEVWLASDIDPTAMLDAERRVYSSVMRRAADSSESQNTPPNRGKGLSLRTRRTETIPDSAGRTRVIVTTTEYTALDHGPIDRSVFEVPAGYRVMDLRYLARANPQGTSRAGRRTIADILCPKGR